MASELPFGAFWAALLVLTVTSINWQNGRSSKFIIVSIPVASLSLLLALFSIVVNFHQDMQGPSLPILSHLAGWASLILIQVAILFSFADFERLIGAWFWKGTEGVENWKSRSISILFLACFSLIIAGMLYVFMRLPW
jgi:hypothetical protein